MNFAGGQICENKVLMKLIMPASKAATKCLFAKLNPRENGGQN